MPELPEVETMRRGLVSAVEGAVIASVRLFHADILLDGSPRSRFERGVRGRAIRAVERRGKNLIFRLGDGAAGNERGREGGGEETGGDAPAVLLVQVRMTGRFAVAPADDHRGMWLREEIGFGHVAAEFGLADGRTLLYDDVRRLGGFLLLGAGAWAERESVLGPEPLASGFRAADLAVALGAGRAPVKNALLDQRRVAGIGNIYASEALFRASIDPVRPCAELAGDDVRRLHRGLRAVLREALAGSGTTLRDYRAVNGQSGSFQERLRVYGREGLPCGRCGAPIRRIVQAGRSTFYCASCQL
ncbi:MAG: bifunctional DNA-formamidopyrimidine glycosylase/DNA-(apurinic or apyrimidinic site) lyase [Gemmatimonadota bacterium]